MRSMTGYGNYYQSGEYYDIQIEIQSVNHRFLDLSINNNSIISNYTVFIREKISSILRRGRVTVKVSVTDKVEHSIELNIDYLKKLFDLHNQANKHLGLNEKFCIQEFLKYDGVLIRGVTNINNKDFDEILDVGVDKCLENYLKMTIKEGQKMEEWISSSIIRIKNAVDSIEEYLPLYRKELKNKLTRSTDEIVNKFQTENIEQRLMAEISWYIDRCDITEEIIRIKDHLEKIGNILDNKTCEVGKKLNFIFQEMHREIQTIGSKFSNVNVFPSILLIKEEVEKCREIIQNVE